MAIYGDYGYNNFLSINTIGTTITNLNVDEKVASKSIGTQQLESDVIIKRIKTSKDGVRLTIEGNDLSLYDDTTGGSDPVTGDSATISFPRTDDETMKFVMRKRSGISYDSQNVMEMYYSKNATNPGKNYIFIGTPGNVGSSSEYYTDIVQFQEDEALLAVNSNNTSSTGISFFNSKYYSTDFNSGGTRIVFSASQCSSDSGFSNGAFISFNILDNNAATGKTMMLIDKDAVYINSSIYPTTNDSFNLGDSSLKFSTIYSTQYYVGSYALTNTGQDLYWNGTKVFVGTPASGISWSTAVNASIVPDTDSTYNLGSSAPKYFATSYIDVMIGGNIRLTDYILLSSGSSSPSTAGEIRNYASGATDQFRGVPGDGTWVGSFDMTAV